METLSLFFILAALISTGYGVYAAYCTWSFFRAESKREGQQPAMPPVSVIKPVGRMEEGYEENFASFCLQDYPVFELMFAFPRETEPALSALEELKARFPRVDIRWTVADPGRGPNYKVGNLIPAVEKARYPLLVISDSDMLVDSEYLRRTVTAFLQENVGLVTSLYRNIRVGNIHAALQALTVQTTFIPNVLFSRKVEGISYAFGATLCTSKEILASVGGMEVFLDYLADDFQMGRRIHRKGHEISLSPFLIDQVSRTGSFRQYFLQQLRWAITQRVCRPLGYFGSIITHQVLIALIFFVLERFSGASLALFMSIVGIRIMCAGFLNAGSIHNRELNRYIWLTPFNDLLNSLFWLLSIFCNTVEWKGRRFRLLKGGKMAEVSKRG